MDVGLAADVGTLQRMPKTLGSESLMRELAFTGRNMHAAEASSSGEPVQLLTVLGLSCRFHWIGVIVVLIAG